MIFSNRFIDVAFGDHPVGKLLSSLNGRNATVSAARLLTALDGESESLLEELFDHLRDLDVSVDIDDLPVYSTDSQTGQRLHLEDQLVKKGDLRQTMDETDPLRMYLEELAGVPTVGDSNILAEKLKQANRNEDENAPVRADVLNLYLHRVVEIACNYTGRGVLLMDLIQEGSMGLWESLPNFIDGDMEHFCNHWIGWYMDKAVVTQAYAAGVGQKLRQGMKDYRDADQRLLSELGRNPTLKEIAEAIHVTAEEAATYAAMLDQARLRKQVDDLHKPKEETSDDTQAVENTAYFQTRQRILAMLSTLTEQEAKLLTLRFGLEGGQPMDPRQAGQALGLPPEEVIKMEAAALQKLRQNKEEL